MEGEGGKRRRRGRGDGVNVGIHIFVVIILSLFYESVSKEISFQKNAIQTLFRLLPRVHTRPCLSAQLSAILGLCADPSANLGLCFNANPSAIIDLCKRPIPSS